MADGKTQRAVIESIIVMGEAANNVMRLAPELELRSPELWQHLKDVCDMRNLVTHSYFRVDVGVVWGTVKDDLPNFESLLKDVSIENDGSKDGSGGSTSGGPPRPK